MPTIACHKEMSIRVVVPPTPLSAYWTLDEAGGSVDRIDSQTGMHLLALGITEPGVPALFSNGVEFSGAFGGADYQTNSEAILAHAAGVGFSLFGWFNILSTGGAGALGGPACTYFFSLTHGEIGIWVGSSVDPQPVRIRSRDDSVFVNVVIGVWHFFHCFYDPVLHQYGYSLDNGANNYLPSVVVPAATAGGTIQLLQNFTFINGQVIFDEIGVKVDALLTASQVSYLWNGGAGRTWPIVLPP